MYDFLKLKQNQSALMIGQAMITLDPTNRFAVQTCAAIHISLDQPLEAIRQYSRLFELGGGTAQDHDLYGMLLHNHVFHRHDEETFAALLLHVSSPEE